MLENWNNGILDFWDAPGESSPARAPVANSSHAFSSSSPLLAGTIQFNSMECGGRAQRRPRFASSTRPRSHTPNGSSNPNRSTVLPLAKGEGRGEGEGRVQLHRCGLGPWRE